MEILQARGTGVARPATLEEALKVYDEAGDAEFLAGAVRLHLEKEN